MRDSGHVRPGFLALATKGMTVLFTKMGKTGLRTRLGGNIFYKLTISSADEDAEQLELSYIADGNAKGYIAFLESRLVVSYKVKLYFTI